MKRSTSPLNNVRVASPCSAEWNAMYGDDRKRFCGDCKLNVYNLSGMTRDEAENLLVTTEGRLCVRFYRRADGTILTKDCPVGWRALKRKVSRTAAAAFSLIAGFFGGVVGFSVAEESNEVGRIERPVSTPNDTMTMGAIYYEPESDKAGMAELGEIVETRGEVVGMREAPRPSKHVPFKPAKGH
jgi:hypothetical protein